MEIYLDTAEVDEVRAAAELGVLRGVTTNPSHMMKAGHRDLEQAIKLLCAVSDVPVSAEVTAVATEDMLRQAREIATWAPNVVVKFPTTTEGLKAMAVFSREEHEARSADGRAVRRRVPINATVIFSPGQAAAASLAGASYVSPFLGRLDSVGQEGLRLVRDVAEIFRVQGVETKIISAALRNPIHVIESWKAGAHICTMSSAVLEQLLHHPLTDQAVEQFTRDWQQLQATEPTNV
ncbi:MAG: transaldolase family protein [Candidatus Dormibacteraceae bacterium]